MAENLKKLNQENLENVNGGGNIETDPSALTWKYDLGKTITIANDNNSWEKYQGQVTKLGYLSVLKFYTAYYYVDCGNANFDGWYSENDIAAEYSNNARRANAEFSASAVVVKE